MSNINVSGSLIQDAVNLCNSVINMLTDSQKNIQSEYENAGRNWNDSKYQKFGDIVEERIRTSGGNYVILNDGRLVRIPDCVITKIVRRY